MTCHANTSYDACHVVLYRGSRGNFNAEFNADRGNDHNTDFGMATECIQPGTVIFVETFQLDRWCAQTTSPDTHCH
jgi:hypothetical protein